MCLHEFGTSLRAGGQSGYQELSYLFFFRYRLPKYIYLPTYQEFWPLEVGSACLVAYQPLHIVGHLKSINIPMLSYSIQFIQMKREFFYWVSRHFQHARIFSVDPSDLPFILLRDGFATGGLNFNLFFAKGYCLSKQKILKYTMVQFKTNVDF